MTIIYTNTVNVGTLSNAGQGIDNLYGYAASDSLYNNTSSAVGSLSSSANTTMLDGTTDVIKCCSVVNFTSSLINFPAGFLMEFDTGTSSAITISNFESITVGAYTFNLNAASLYLNTSSIAVAMWYIPDAIRDEISGTTAGGSFVINVKDDDDTTDLAYTMGATSTWDTDELYTIDGDFNLYSGETLLYKLIHNLESGHGLQQSDMSGHPRIQIADIPTNNIPTTWSAANTIFSNGENLGGTMIQPLHLDAPTTLSGDVMSHSILGTQGMKRGNFASLVKVSTRKQSGQDVYATDYLLVKGTFEATTFGDSKDGLPPIDNVQHYDEFSTFFLKHTSTGSESFSIDTDANLGTKADNIQYKINSGSWTSGTSGTLNEGDQISIRSNRPSTYDTQHYIKVTVGFSSWVGFLTTARELVLHTHSLTNEFFGYNGKVGFNTTTNFSSYSQGGSITHATLPTTMFDPAADFKAFLWSKNTNYLDVVVSGLQDNTGWEGISIDNRFVYKRKDATYTRHSAQSPQYTRWSWDAQDVNIIDPMPDTTNSSTDGVVHEINWLSSFPHEKIVQEYVVENPNSSNTGEGSTDMLRWATASQGLLKEAQFLQPTISAQNSASMIGYGNLKLASVSGCEVAFFLGDNLFDATSGGRASGMHMRLDYHFSIEDVLYVGMKIFSEDGFMFRGTITDFYEWNGEMHISYDWDSLNSVKNILAGDRIFGIVQVNDNLPLAGNRSINLSGGVKQYKDLVQIHPDTSSTGRYFANFESTYFAGVDNPSNTATWQLSGYNGPTNTVTVANSSTSTSVSESFHTEQDLIPQGGSVKWNVTLNLSGTDTYSYATLGLGNCLLRGDSFSDAKNGASFVVEPIYEGEHYRAQLTYHFPNNVTKTFTVEGEVLDATDRSTIAVSSYTTNGETIASKTNIELERGSAQRLVFQLSNAPQQTVNGFYVPTNAMAALLKVPFDYTVTNVQGGTVHHEKSRFLFYPGGKIYTSPAFFVPDDNATAWQVTLAFTLDGDTWQCTWSGTVVDDYGIRIYDGNGAVRVDKHSRQMQIIETASGTLTSDLNILQTSGDYIHAEHGRYLTLQDADSVVAVTTPSDSSTSPKVDYQPYATGASFEFAVRTRYNLNESAYDYKVVKI